MREHGVGFGRADVSPRMAGAYPLIVNAPSGLQVRSAYRAGIPLRPLQFETVTAFADAVEQVVVADAQTRGLSALSVRWWLQTLRIFAKYLASSGQAGAFLSGDVEAQLQVIDLWVRWLHTERRVSHVTVRTYFDGMNAITQRLERARGMVNPFGLLMPPPPGRPRIRVLTRDQAEALVSGITHFRWDSSLMRARNLAAVGLMLYAGMRRGEVLGLKTGDVSVAKGVAFIRKAKARFGGKPRTVYFPPQLRTILTGYLRERDAAKPRRTHQELLTLTTRDAPMTELSLKRLFTHLSKIAGFHVSPHMLRHTYATLLRQSGVADRVSMELMGHQSLAMLTRYSHVFDPEYEQEARKLTLDVDLPIDRVA